MDIVVYTDGACFPNPGQGGWAWTDLKGRSGSGGLNPTTNQVMELTAVLEAIKAFDVDVLRIITDSMYVIEGATNWSIKWEQNGWRRANDKPLLHAPLWQEIRYYMTHEKKVIFEWVRGHSGNPGNEEADRLASIASQASPRLIAHCERKYRKR